MQRSSCAVTVAVSVAAIAPAAAAGGSATLHAFVTPILSRQILPALRLSSGRRLRPKALSNNSAGRHEYDEFAKDPKYWSRWGAPATMYGQRNSALAAMLGGYHARRVFEFAGNGGFFAQRALNTSSVLERLEMWTHSD